MLQGRELLGVLSQVAGDFRGAGRLHAGETFEGRLSMTPVVGGLGITFAYVAIGVDGRSLHAEHGWIASAPDGRLHLWLLTESSRVVLDHPLREAAVEDDGRLRLVFGEGDLLALVPQISLTVHPGGDLEHEIAWAMPGQPLLPRLTARMTSL